MFPSDSDSALSFMLFADSNGSSCIRKNVDKLKYSFEFLTVILSFYLCITFRFTSKISVVYVE